MSAASSTTMSSPLVGDLSSPAELATITGKIASIEANLRTCILERKKPKMVKAAATEARDTCLKLREQIRLQLSAAREKRDEAEKKVRELTATQPDVQDMKKSLGVFEGELFDTRRALEAKTSELAALQEKLNNQHASFTQAKAQFNQLKQQNMSLNLRLQQLKQHSGQSPTTTHPAVTPHGAAAVPGTA